jgi:prephenate dehydrogenase
VAQPGYVGRAVSGNRDVLIKELDYFIDSVIKYRDALISNNKDTMRSLLDEGRMIKEELDGR